MAKQAVYDYSTTPGSNTDIDGVDSTGTTGLVKSGDNYARSMMAHAKGFALDLGAVNTVGGTADAITVTLAAAPSALVDGMRITINASAANTGATTLNATPAGGSAFGAKKVLKWSAGSEAELSAGDIPAANALIELVYDSARDTAAGAWMLLGSSSSIPYTAASASGAASLQFAEDTDNGTNKVTLQGAASTADVTVTLPSEAGTLGVVVDEDDMASNSATKVPSQQSVKAYVDGKAITLGTATASTSGTSVDFTGIPAGVKRVTVNLAGVSTSGTSVLFCRIGDSGGFENTGYVGSGGVNGGTVTPQTAGYALNAASVAAGIMSGTITLTLLDSANNTWAMTSLLARSDTGSMFFGGGYKSLSGVLTQVQLIALNGSDTFDAGTVNITYES